jgi:hypothetical protein
MYLAIKYGGGSGWAFLLAVVASIAAIGLGARVSEVFWKPYIDAQERLRRQTRSEKARPPEQEGKKRDRGMRR